MSPIFPHYKGGLSSAHFSYCLYLCVSPLSLCSLYFLQSWNRRAWKGRSDIHLGLVSWGKWNHLRQPAIFLILSKMNDLILSGNLSEDYSCDLWVFLNSSTLIQCLKLFLFRNSSSMCNLPSTSTIHWIIFGFNGRGKIFPVLPSAIFF